MRTLIVLILLEVLLWTEGIVEHVVGFDYTVPNGPSELLLIALLCVAFAQDIAEIIGRFKD